MSGDCCIGIGGGDIPAVGRGCLLRLQLIEATLKLPVGFCEILLDAPGIHHRVIGGIGIDEAGIGKELCAVNQTIRSKKCLKALTPHRARALLKTLWWGISSLRP